MGAREEVERALRGLTEVMGEALRSDRPERLAEVGRVAACAQKLIRATSLRAEDFGDPSGVNIGYMKRSGHNEVNDVAVPPKLNGVVGGALRAIVAVMEAALSSDRTDRFSEVERLSKTAQQLLLDTGSVKEKESGKHRDPVREGVDHMVQMAEADYGAVDVYGGDRDLDEGGFQIRPARHYPTVTDTQQLRREAEETQGVRVRVEAELRMAEIARHEAEELVQLKGLLEDEKDEALASVLRERLAQLRSKLEMRTKFRGGVQQLLAQQTERKSDEMVPADVPRGHNPREGREERDPGEGEEPDGQRGGGDGGAPREGDGQAHALGEALGEPLGV